MILANFLNRLTSLFNKTSVMTMATLLLTKLYGGLAMAQALALSYWGIFPQDENYSHLAAVDAMKDNYYQHLQLPSRDEYPCHAKQWPTPTSPLLVDFALSK